ncbi:spidroin-2 [Dermacentor silvarum]|uniref:spidroin-2 n=1 Tax=Dermacentor silvarum TaxID=543639 RepID=UPI002100E320|nr:spidroin-2 [Dermacentor silvarum]
MAPVLPSEVQVLLVWLVGEAYAQHHNQPTQSAQRGVGFQNYPAPAAPYGGGYDAYASLFQTPAQYGFGYNTAGEYNTQQFGAGQDGSNFAKAGFYGYPDASGLYRQMNYVDAVQRARASVGSAGTNVPGTAPGVTRHPVFNAAPIVRPVPTASAQEAAAAAYGPRPAAPNAGGYRAYGQPAPNPYALAAGAFEYAPYGGYGYGSSRAALGGQAYSSYPYGPAGYTAGYNPGVNGEQAWYTEDHHFHFFLHLFEDLVVGREVVFVRLEGLL